MFIRVPKKDPYLGKRIQDYQILDIIGKGGMGKVYLARNAVLQQDHAIKVIGGRLAEDEDFLERFVREAKILMRLRHPNLVQLHEFITAEDDTFFMVLELIRGESVLQRIRRLGRIPLQQSIKIIREAACGLHSAHQEGIIHRDISPDNLMIVKQENGNELTKVLDFGIAKPMFETTYHGLTKTKFFIGKPEYCSPEQCGLLAENEVIDQRTDLYSLAITYYYMLAGRLPFLSATFQGYLMKHLYETPRPVSSFAEAGEFPPALDAVLMKALSKDRNHRQHSLEEFIKDLDMATSSEASASEIFQGDTQEKRKPTLYVSHELKYQAIHAIQKDLLNTTKAKPVRTASSLITKQKSLPNSLSKLTRTFGRTKLIIASTVLMFIVFGYLGTRDLLFPQKINVVINAVPWARVQISSESKKIKLPQKVWLTPFNIDLPPGKYSLRLENDYSERAHVEIIEVSEVSNVFLIQMPKYDVESALSEIKESSGN